MFIACQGWANWDLRASEVPLILYLGLGIALIGHSLWVHAVTALSTTTTSILSYLYLPFSLIMGFVFLGEKLAGRALVGASLVLFANAVVIVSQHYRGALGKSQ